MPAIVWPDMEMLAIQYLHPALQARPEPYAADVTVRNTVPSEKVVNGVPQDPWPASGRLVVVRYDGGPTTPDVRATARLGVRVWGSDEAEASDLANLAVALVRGWNDRTVKASRPTLPYSVTEDSGRPAQYFTAELTIRGRALPAA